MDNIFSPTWTVHEHVIPASWPRGYRRGVRDPSSSRLRLHVKEYIPDRSTLDSENAITLIVQHGMPPGDNKESYEPFLWDLISQANLPPTRAIWAADCVGSGQSYLLNKDDIGDEPHWFDAARDMMQMINHFQDRMKPPLIGFGQSWGCVAPLMCASWHARIFQSIILSEPVIETGWFHANDPRNSRNGAPQLSRSTGRRLALRKAGWSSREEACQYFRKIYGMYDGRVLEQILKYDLCDLDDGTVTLTAPTAQAVPMFMRASPPLPGYPEGEDYANRPYESNYPPGYYNAMGSRVKEAMPSINCRVLYLWAKQEDFISDEPYRQRLVSITGVGIGGGGGVPRGQINEIFVDGGHSLPLQVPENTAVAVAEWLTSTFWPWWQEEERKRLLEAPISSSCLSGAFMQRLAETRDLKL